MKIVAQTPTELIIRDSALTLRGLGVFITALGAFAIWIGLTNDAERVGVVPVVVGSLMMLGGLALVVLPARKTFAFSRAERVFIIAKERFGRVERESFPLDQIADVSLEESRSSDEGSTYRVSVTLADQRRIPWTSYYSSGVASKQAAVDLVREFLRLEPSPTLGSGAPTVKSERDARRGRAGLFFTPVGVHRDSAHRAHVHRRGDPGQPGSDAALVSRAVVRLTPSHLALGRRCRLGNRHRDR